MPISNLIFIKCIKTLPINISWKITPKLIINQAEQKQSQQNQHWSKEDCQKVKNWWQSPAISWSRSFYHCKRP